MVEYTCFRCEYTTCHKNSFKNHLNRKNICKSLLEDISIEEVKFYYCFENDENCSTKIHQNPPKSTKIHQNNIHQNPPKSTKNDKLFHQNPPKSTKIHQNEKKSYICEFCNNIFSRSDSLNRHYYRCKIKKKSQELIHEQKEELIEMKKEIEELKKIKINTQNNIVNNNTVNNTININNYGDENLKHLRTRDFTNLLKGIYGAVPKLIEKIHFDPNHPENQNIKYTNKKLPYLKVMKNNKWQLVNKKHELLDLIDNKCFLLKEKYYNILEKKKLHITTFQKNKIEEFINKYHEEDKKLMLDLIEHTELLLLNNS